MFWLWNHNPFFKSQSISFSEAAQPLLLRKPCRDYAVPFWHQLKPWKVNALRSLSRRNCQNSARCFLSNSWDAFEKCTHCYPPTSIWQVPLEALRCWSPATAGLDGSSSEPWSHADFPFCHLQVQTQGQGTSWVSAARIVSYSDLSVRFRRLEMQSSWSCLAK